MEVKRIRFSGMECVAGVMRSYVLPLRQDGSCNVFFMTYEQEVIIKCAIKGTLGGLDRRMTSEELDELLNGSQDWRKHLVIEEITEVATIHAGRRRPEID
jgi:hypothetical protein